MKMVEWDTVCLYPGCMEKAEFRTEDTRTPRGRVCMCDGHWKKYEPDMLCAIMGVDAHDAHDELSLERLVLEMRRLGVAEAFGVRLDTNWSPPEKPAEEPRLDKDPKANALALAALRAKDNLEKELLKRAADDTVTFAPVNGVPE